jgi:hypothetical protein
MSPEPRPRCGVFCGDEREFFLLMPLRYVHIGAIIPAGWLV